MPNADSRNSIRVKGKTRKLQRALIRELAEHVQLGQCRDWVATAYGYKEYDNLLRNYQPGDFAFDEHISEQDLKVRLAAQAHSLAFDFDLDALTAQRLIDEVRPSALRSAKTMDRGAEVPR